MSPFGFLPRISMVLMLIWSCSCQSDVTPTVVIVGAGIGGTSCAYYLEKYMGDVDIVVLETGNRIGGRVYDVIIDGTDFNIGAYAWSGYQRYIKELAKEMELETTDQDLEGDLIFVSPFGFTTWTGQDLVDTGELQLRHNESMQIIEKEALDFTSRMVDNYDQRGNETFSSMEEYLSYGELLLWSQLSSREYYTDKGVDLEMQDLAMAPNQNLITNNGMNSHVFSMQLALTVDMGTGRVLGGNSQLVHALLEASAADLLLNSTVHEIKQLETQLEITYNVNGVQHTMQSDYVVIAAPLENTGIQFVNFDLPIDPPVRQWHNSYVYIVIADGMNPKYFNESAEWEEPSLVVGSPSFSEVGGFLYCFVDAIINGSKYYSLTTSYDVIEELDSVFINPKPKFVHHWEYNHAVLEPRSPDEYQEIILAPYLYNIGAVEDIMSQMEGSIIMARDIALLITSAHNNSNVLVGCMITIFFFCCSLAFLI